jgi:hypothetical protein
MAVACFLFHLLNCDAKECPLYFFICEHNLGQPVGLTSLWQINAVLITFGMFAEFAKSSAERLFSGFVFVVVKYCCRLAVIMNQSTSTGELGRCCSAVWR